MMSSVFMDSIICYPCYFYVIFSASIVIGERVSFYFIVFGLILFFNPILKNRREKQPRFFDLFRHSFVFKKIFYNPLPVGNNRFELMNLRC